MCDVSTLIPKSFPEPYKILTRKMIDVATEKYDFDYYSQNPRFHTFGNKNNTYRQSTLAIEFHNL